MLGVEIEIVRYVDDSPPGWVEFQLVDSRGERWSFIEKVPVVTSAQLGAASLYPQRGQVPCKVLWRIGNVALIDMAQPWGFESVEGKTRFEVLLDCLVEW